MGDIHELFVLALSLVWFAGATPERSIEKKSFSIKRNILVSVKFFLSAILGPEMGAPIIWAPGVFAFFLQENLHVHKIPIFRGDFVFFFGGGSADFIFMGAGSFLKFQ